MIYMITSRSLGHRALFEVDGCLSQLGLPVVAAHKARP